jgi:hypothetical protein
MKCELFFVKTQYYHYYEADALNANEEASTPLLLPSPTMKG